MSRLAIIDPNRCKPNKCNLECKRNCPEVLQDIECIVVEKKDKTAIIKENLCIGCGICVKKCPFNAIKIVNVPILSKSLVLHRYGMNSFQINKICHLKKGVITGILGPNGIGKSTLLKILSNKLDPNFGSEKSIQKSEIVSYFKGTESQNYFEKLYKGEITPILKPQHTDHISEIEGVKDRTVSSFLDKHTMTELDLVHLENRCIKDLSGGELQRFSIAIAGSKNSGITIFDEPTNYLDILQRVKMSRYIHSLSSSDKYVIVCDHDISILDYISDYVHLIVGKEGMYGVVSPLYTTSKGINIYLSGYSPADNLRFRSYEIKFRPPKIEPLDLKVKVNLIYEIEKETIKKGDFVLNVNGGSLNSSEVTIFLGQNGTGKTTFLRNMFEKLLKTKTVVSYKPQHIKGTFEGTVEELFNEKIRSAYSSTTFRINVIKPLGVDNMLDKEMCNLSGGEKQRVGIVLALGRKADIYLFDEPSAFLDCEQRVNVAYVIKKFICDTQSTCIVVEHDLNMCLYLGDKVMVFNGKPGIECSSSGSLDFSTGINLFLESIEITIRTDEENGRPRINKYLGSKDREQKKNKTYFKV